MGIKDQLLWMAQIYLQMQNDAEGAKKLAGLSAGDLAVAMTGIDSNYKAKKSDWKAIATTYWQGHQDYTTEVNGKPKQFKSAEEFYEWGGWFNPERLKKMQKYYTDTVLMPTMNPFANKNTDNLDDPNNKNGLDLSGYENTYDRHTGRPTQIVINIDKLANFDKSQFLTADQQQMSTMVLNAVNDGLMELIPQINYALAAVDTNSNA